MRTAAVHGLLCMALALAGCEKHENSLSVTATAYTSSPQETDSTPSVTAWGDTLKPGMKAIAVSRDLIDMGLTHQQDVKIQGFDGSFRVLDKMNRRWEKRIDIYMDNNRKKARNWGKQEVTIFW
ncbi:3D domain-containing protein [Prosthecochloris sp. N3]|uniref:3D domain-containing protein n=1 Tax=Prosthecochloris ethylica TaxID=2743976 RepID=A0ABR9XQA2_9CHLB|nr:3D domain-containing protein [Prosthecochloris ethylica]MBF0586274.1 3D domain-containing protein [Prosthecochloris ethylica]MBF0635980.1 3D domain-containing protein [Prosthecochloris ethylica]NUK47345.1 3D domain-containing protein [Prosthecochloris ethylica]